MGDMFKKTVGANLVFALVLIKVHKGKKAETLVRRANAIQPGNSPSAVDQAEGV
jgi:hypothetical protein